MMAYTPTYIGSVLQANLRDVSIKKVYPVTVFLCVISLMATG